MDPLGPRAFSRSVLRSHIDELRRGGLFDATRAEVSPKVRALLEDPRDAPAWLDGECFDELNAAVFKLRGRDGLRDLLAHVMRGGLAKVLEPIIQLSLKFFGGTPAALFSRAEALLSVNTRNIKMKWTPTSPAGGVVSVFCGETVPPVSWIAWEGIFLYVLTLAGATGRIGEARPLPDGQSCEIDVAWTTR
jgi:hypothetical protein